MMMMMMITGDQEYEEGYNCQMKYNSFGCFQWLCTTAFRKLAIKCVLQSREITLKENERTAFSFLAT